MRMGLGGAEARPRAPPWPMRCCSGRCATASASPSCARRRPAARRSGPDTFRFFQAMGVPLRQLYGQTETLGAYTVHRAGRREPGHRRRRLQRPDRDPHRPAGRERRRRDRRRATPTCSPAISAWRRTPDLRDGWLHTGDAGYFDKSGHLVVIDRIKDIATTSRRRPLPPAIHREQAEIQPLCRGSGGARRRRPHLAAMICIRFPIVCKWAERQPHRLHHLHRPRRPSPRCWTCCGARCEGVNATLPRAAAHPRLHPALQGAGRRRRGADPHPQGPPRRHQREVRRHHRGDLPRRARHPGGHHHRLPGRHEAAHPHHAARRAHAEPSRGGHGAGGGVGAHDGLVRCCCNSRSTA